MAQCTREQLEYIVNHVVLPLKLPQQAEAREIVSTTEQALLNLVLSVTGRFCQQCSAELKAHWLVVQDMLTRWYEIKPHGDLPEKSLAKALLALSPGHVLPIRIRAQNAGLIFRRHPTDLSIECFELSPRSEDVIGCKGSLRQSFPAHGIAVPIEVATHSKFCHALCKTLTTLDSETVAEMMPQSQKAGSQWSEIRDTSHPALVTELLTATLAAVGRPFKVTQVHKRIRDDVLWHKALLPWRRSTLWLLLRVAVQTTLARSLGPGESVTQYKNFMAYLLTDIMSLASRLNLATDLCKMVQMKVARRVDKLRGNVLQFVHEFAYITVNQVGQAQTECWSNIQERDANRMTTVNLSTVERDTNLTLSNCRPALDAALRKVDQGPQPKLQLQSVHQDWFEDAKDDVPVVNTSIYSSIESIYALAEFERWVWQVMPTWLEKALIQPRDTQCMAIADSAAHYKEMALEVYDGCAAQMSLMLLTIGELWRALDTIAGVLVPLLHRYSPEIPSHVFQPLLLSKKAQMQRLQELEVHLNRRHKNTECSRSDILVNPRNSDTSCFASQYFQESDTHQQLWQEIVDDANAKRSAKESEWRRKSDEYKALKEELDTIDNCTFYFDAYGDERHASGCRKCSLSSQIRNLSIDVFEWPLPEEELQCRSTIFELRCPAVIAAWRNLTWMIIHDLGRREDANGSNPEDRVYNYSGLRRYHESSNSRIILGATTKSVTVSHYRKLDFPVRQESVYCAHALRWRFYDEKRSCWIEDQTDDPSFSSMCCISLPEGPYQNLQYAVNWTAHAQNDVLAAQTDCSPELSLHEYIAFGSLRADGEQTQWLNICRELTASNLTWNTASVCCLIQQSAWQCGSSGAQVLRLAHAILGVPEFSGRLLSNLSDLLDSIQANRQSLYAMNVIIILILRTLSLSNGDAAARAIGLLHNCRSILSTWTGGLIDSLRTTADAKQITSIRRRLLRAALLSKVTFDVDEQHIVQVMATSGDVDHWVTSSILVQDNTPGAESELPADLRRLIIQDRKLSHSLHRRLQDTLTTTTNTGLDDAVSRIWSAFRSSAVSWGALEKPHHRWVQKLTSRGNGNEPQTVCYNVLNGQLLIDGRPLGTLPKEYTTHGFFKKIFGAQILRVSASDMAGMLYMTAAEEFGYTFYFVLRETRLVIRAKGASTIYELIPHEEFSGDFPTRFVECYTHWLDLSTNEMEFRPLDRKWAMNPKNWRLLYKPHGGSHLQDGEEQLVDIRSRTCQEVSAVFGGLERDEFMHVTRSSGGRVRIALPRLSLRFFMNDDGELECQELRKVVDRDQSIGTLIGLESRLVLCAQGNRSRRLDRTILIPRGVVSTVRNGDHLVVGITPEGQDVHCLLYQHNSILNRLEGDGSFISRVYQAYLHALTSYILPDPLTGLLGTEQSPRILDEQVFRCSKPLNSAEVDLLNSIAELTPRREFYPEHLRVMQQVSWHTDLTPLSQHGGFADVTQRIVAQSRKFLMFYPDAQSVPGRLNIRKHGNLKLRGDAYLLERANVRSSAYRNADYGGNEHTTADDVVYKARDIEYQPDRAARAYEIAAHIVRWPTDIHITSQLETRWRQWTTVSGFGTTFNLSRPVSELLALDFASAWASLYALCRQADRRSSQFTLLFLFSHIAYGSEISSLDDLKVLIAFATNPSLKQLPPFPTYASFTLGNGSCPGRSQVHSVIKSNLQPYVLWRQDLTAAQRRQEKLDYEKVSSANVNSATDHCMSQWPSQQLSPIPSTCGKWLNIRSATTAMQGLFAEWYKNRECEAHLAKIQAFFDAMTAPVVATNYAQAVCCETDAMTRDYQTRLIPMLRSLVQSRDPCAPPEFPSILHIEQVPQKAAITADLRSLITGFGAESTASDGLIRAHYKSDLLKSLDAYQNQLDMILPGAIAESLKGKAFSSFEECEQHCLSVFGLLSDILKPRTRRQHLLDIAGLWPRHRMQDMLEMIATSSPTNVPPAWLSDIVVMGISITFLQRARRMILAVEKHDTSAFYKEAENPGRLHWSAEERPDWLLLEIENDLLVRPIQARVALEMIVPSSSSNTLMQLNMGEGKSSVIIPLIATALADRNQFVRVVVLRSLTRQMQDTIMQRLGGLARRPIYFMPFSRKTTTDASVITRMKAMYQECMANGGILLVQPEHILSFKLMGLERLASGQNTMAARLLETQAWLDEHCHDVLDESDEILDVKFQLIYTLGTQRSMDGQPDRWVIMQGIFDLVQHHARLMQSLYPRRIEVSKQANASFPAIRLLSAKVRRLLISSVLEDICNSKLPGLVMSNLPARVKKAATALIAEYDILEEECTIVQSYCAEDENYLKKLLLLRGLISGGILMHVLHAKRWSVTYGLHPSRCLCAVPYRAKGVPAPTAEFGHPDVMIALTCLSYYYTGLTDNQLRSCLEIVQKVDDPSFEYETWVKADQTFPQKLQHWNAVNLEDRQQCDDHLFPALRYNKKAADFFLTNVVFPKEGKEFDQKLSTSGWDIPARPGSKKVTTGFSGTNDNRFLLPSLISQDDLPELQHTSAKVLEILSRHENISYYCAKDEKGAQLSSEGLLGFIRHVDPNVRVLIDVGAQILDLGNDQVVARWLSIFPDADAGVYFDEDDYAMVLTRAGKRERLSNSSFSKRMDRCIVYLDDVHTRGTDLKLPRTARAAVTLGPRLVKDRLVQACMRLRQLGHGQSLMYVGPPEVHRDISKTTSRTRSDKLNGLNVIEWALGQSCLQIERNQPLRVMQGLNYHRRREILEELNQCLPAINQSGEPASFEGLVQRIAEHDAQSLADLYAPEAMRQKDSSDMVTRSREKPDKDVQDLVKLWDQIGIKASQGASMHEEHEREVAHEVEQETQIERPPGAKPWKPKVDPYLADFIRTGTLASMSRFDSAYAGVLKHCSSAHLLRGRQQAWSRIRVSQDFVNTIIRSKSSVSDDYMRPVHWVLIAKDKAVDNALLISQYEVNEMFSDIQAPSSRVVLICYEPRVTRSMPSLDTSTGTSFSLPLAKEAWESLSDAVRQEVHMFAGQLYFTSFKEYEHLGDTLATENAVPLDFIKEWVGIRRKGQNYLQTHVGQIVSGRVLHREMFETDKSDVTIAI